MTLKELHRKIGDMIANDRFRGDAQVTFKAGINAVEYAARSIAMEQTHSGLIVARIS